MSEKVINCKIVLLGESEVGKTCILNRFLGNPFSEEHLMTVGADHQSKDIEIDNKKVKVTFWDTLGQECFRALSKMFYQGSDIIILVYDITKKKSFTEIQNYWLQQVRENNIDLSGILLYF